MRDLLPSTIWQVPNTIRAHNPEGMVSTLMNLHDGPKLVKRAPAMLGLARTKDEEGKNKGDGKLFHDLASAVKKADTKTPGPTEDLEMTGPRFSAVESTSANRLVLIVPVLGQKVKGVSPSPLEVGFRSREQEPARTSDRTAIATSFGHDVDT